MALAPINSGLVRGWMQDLISVIHPVVAVFRGLPVTVDVGEAYKSREMQIAGVTIECQYEVRITDLNVAGGGVPLDGEFIDWDGSRYRIVSARPSVGAFYTLLVSYSGQTPEPMSEPAS